MFFLKKLLSEFLYPLPFCFVILLVGLFFLGRKEKHKSKTRLLKIGIFLLLFFGLRPFSDFAIWTLEKDQQVYEAIPGKHVEYIVVLSGGSRLNEGRPFAQQLGSATLARLIEGIRISKLHPQATLLLSGGSVGSSTSMAELMKGAALEMGVQNERILIETNSRDTEDQAIMLKPMIDHHRIVLVTSANHMKRSLGLFKKQSILTEVAPCDFRFSQNIQNPWYWIIPHSVSLMNWRSVIHEYVGYAWSKLRSKI